MNHDIFLLLGSNEGDREANLAQARQAIKASVGTIVKSSSLYKTAAWGVTEQPEFYNQVIQVTTVLDPAPLLTTILYIEESLGRVRIQKWGPRIIDIDILFYNTTIIESDNLTIPHVGIPHRRFTLVPLHEIAPDFLHPVLKKSIRRLLRECTDTLSVTLVR
jgi:2-amino-4-hydroxy-6-hydroxymethyldihydropteridine diphosphokinase